MKKCNQWHFDLMITSMTENVAICQKLLYVGFDLKNNQFLFELLRNSIVDYTMPTMTTSMKWITQVWATHTSEPQ